MHIVPVLYDGSHLFDKYVPKVGFGADKLNLVFCQLVAILIAWAYRRYCPPDPEKRNRRTRLLIPLLAGVAFCYFCYGEAIYRLFHLATVSYVLLHVQCVNCQRRGFDDEYLCLITFVQIWVLLYTIYIHFWHWLYLTDALFLDVVGPMMIMVQKIFMLMLSIHDGRIGGHLTKIKREEALSRIPPLLDYYSYLFNFQTVLTGPMFVYKDYIAFIEGEDVKKANPRAPNQQNGAEQPATPAPDPSKPAFQKLYSALGCLLLVICFAKRFDPQQIVVAAKASKLGWLEWLLHFYLAMLMHRCKYYYAWIMADAICNTSGFGFNGYSKKGNEKWNLLTNVKVWKVEMVTNFKLEYRTVDGWNVRSTHWWRRLIYERVSLEDRTWFFRLSNPIWHGFLFGKNLLAYLTGSLFVVAANKVRSSVRPRLPATNSRHQKKYKIAYEVVAFFATKFALMYATIPFTTVGILPGLLFYGRHFFLIHLLAMLLSWLVPKYLPPPVRKSTNLLIKSAQAQQANRRGRRRNAG